MAKQQYSKSEVKYTDYGHADARCALCKYYLNPTTCSIVVGRIRPEGWCNKFEKDAA